MKRATATVNSHIRSYFYFNPRPREEGDANETIPKTAKGDFNPRPREEGDFDELYLTEVIQISIHALVKRATFPVSSSKTYSTYFNPRPREEGDFYVV